MLIENQSRGLIKNTFILSIGTLCTKGVMFLMTPLFTRWLSQEDFGTFDLIITYVTLLIPFITLDSGEAVFRFLAESRKDSEHKLIVSSAFAVSIIGFGFTSALALISFFFYSPSKFLIGPFVILLLCEGINTFLVFVVRGLKKLPNYAISNIIFVLGMSFLSWFLVKNMKFGMAGILYAYSGGYVMSIAYISYTVKMNSLISRRNINYQKQKEMLSYSLPLIPNAISWWIINVSNRTVISLILGTASNAIFAVASKIPNLCQTLFGVFHLSWQENAVETLQSSERDAYYSKIMNEMTKVVCAISALILSLNFIFFNIVFTREYSLAYYHVPILILAIVFSMLSQFIGGIYIAMMDSKKNGTTTVAAAIVSIIFILATITWMGLYAASFSVLVAYLFLFVIRYIDVRSRINLKFGINTLLFVSILFYFILCNYINYKFLNWLNVVLATMLLIYTTYPHLCGVVTKFTKRKNK